MAQLTYRANLSAAEFPFISRFGGRTVIIPGPDQNFNRQVQSQNDSDKDVGIPQIYYCHNVMPTGQGFQSIGYESRVQGLPDVSNIFQEIKVREDSTGQKAYLSAAPDRFYLCANETLGYTSQLTTYWDGSSNISLPTNLNEIQITFAHVGGITYLYLENLYCLVYSFTNSRLESVSLSGLTASQILGLTESNGYLIAYSTNAVAWSSTIDPTDFVPSLQTGAGGGNVEGIQGNITCAAPTANGFTVYTAQNAVSVLYTGNARYPFQFSPCQGSGGVESLERVAYEADIGYNYAYTTKGFQILRSKTSDTIFPDLTDFIAGQLFEDFDETNLEFSYQTLLAPMQKKLVLVASRYFVISYGVESLTHAIVYDTVQKRFGKLRIPHVDCFEYDLLSETVSDIPKKSIAFLAADGSISVVNFAVALTNRTGVALFGKYQYVRSKRMQLQSATFENPIEHVGQFNCWCLKSDNGKTVSETIEGTVMNSDTDIIQYGFGAPDGQNISLLAIGTFNLNTIELILNPTSTS